MERLSFNLAPTELLWIVATLMYLTAVLYSIFSAVLFSSLRSTPPIGRILSFSKRRETNRAPSVSVIKPLCGSEPRLFENLSSFCEQSLAPSTQFLFGVSSSRDHAIDVVRRLQTTYPHLDIELVVDPRIHGTNLKVSNLINMESRIRSDIVVLADSDITVTPDYLETVAAPLADPKVGVVTCLYHARSVSGTWSRLGALFINEWFAPSVCLAQAIGSRKFGFGATLALRKETLYALGGFSRLKDCLADDYWLAEHTRALGLATVLSSVSVATDVIESNFFALWSREVRWLRTIRSVNFFGFAFLFLTFTCPWILAGIGLSQHWAAVAMSAASGNNPSANIMNTPLLFHRAMFLLCSMGVLVGALSRTVLHARSARHTRSFWRDLPWVPVRDAISMLQWLAAACGSRVVWRGTRMHARNLTVPTHRPVADETVGG